MSYIDKCWRCGKGEQFCKCFLTNRNGETDLQETYKNQVRALQERLETCKNNRQLDREYYESVLKKCLPHLPVHLKTDIERFIK